ncbi:hypothetical protein [Lysobacter enzymogenes]|uniref:hypothetical protein n=1 Tax=Lysobacter enzymogenes TaxID=69 RepID=UPI001A965170|nr:hypothetical protein [Lysobacter enzymogenes]QQP96528.1 hypothetical protein JHW38_00270 [Lysobacter enzymogenes]
MGEYNRWDGPDESDPAWSVVDRHFDDDLFTMCRADDYVAIYREMQRRMGDGWQPIETAPKDGTWVLLCGGEADEAYCEQTNRPVTAHWVAPDPEYPELVAYPHANFWGVAFWDGSWYTQYVGATHWCPINPPQA